MGKCSECRYPNPNDEKYWIKGMIRSNNSTGKAKLSDQFLVNKFIYDYENWRLTVREQM